MVTPQQKALSTHRRRMKKKGLVRLEVKVRKEDAALLKDVARALADPTREAEARALLKNRFGAPPSAGLKALLASAPLEAIELERSPDTGRPVDL